jgi:hypothetical protein
VIKMGYTHYWHRQKELDPETYGRIVQDFRRLLPTLEKWGVKLAGGAGEGEPQVNDKDVWFNGNEHCGHEATTDLIIPWPTSDARGVLRGGATPTVVAGQWFAGHEVTARCCDGDCSYETFHFPPVLEPHEWQTPDKDGLWFEFCKTAFRPYDLAVTAFLVVAKRHLRDRIKVHSDGEEPHWQDAKWLCQLELGYGLDFQLDPQ